VPAYLGLASVFIHINKNNWGEPRYKLKIQKQRRMQVTYKRYWIYLLLFLLCAINYIDRIALSVSAQPISKEFGLSPVELGYVFSSFLWTYIFCLIPVGILTDRWGSRLTNTVGLGLWSISTIATAFAPSLGFLILTRLAMGAGESTTYPAAGRVIREWAPIKERGFATTVFNAGAYAGPAFGAVAVGWIISLFDWRTAFVIAGLIGLLWLVPWLIFFHKPENARWLPAAERDMILAERDASASKLVPGKGGLGMGDLLRSQTMWGIAITQGCAVYTQYLFLTWLPNYLQTTRDLSILKTGFYTAAPYLGGMILSMLVGRLSDRLLDSGSAKSGTRRLMVVAMMVSSAVILLTPVVDSIWGIVLLFTISLTGISSSIGLNVALVNDLLREPRSAGKAVSLAVIGGNIFGVMAPVVTGYVVASAGGYNMAFAIAGLLLLTGAMSSLLLTRQPIGRDVDLVDVGHKSKDVVATQE
jgi:MFS family permease